MKQRRLKAEMGKDSSYLRFYKQLVSNTLDVTVLTDISTAIAVFNKKRLFTSALYISYTMVYFKAQKSNKLKQQM